MREVAAAAVPATDILGEVFGKRLGGAALAVEDAMAAAALRGLSVVSAAVLGVLGSGALGTAVLGETALGDGGPRGEKALGEGMGEGGSPLAPTVDDPNPYCD